MNPFTAGRPIWLGVWRWWLLALLCLSAVPVFAQKTATIKWTASTTRTVDSYNLYRNGVLIAHVPASNTSYVDKDLKPGSYTYTVTAVAKSIESYPVMATIKIPSPSAALAVSIPSGAISFWKETETPGNTVGNDSRPVELGLRFSSSRSGKIVGLRVYRAENAEGQTIGSVWDGRGKLLTTAAFAESTPGWLTLVFPKGVPVEIGKAYTVSYHTISYAYTGNYFTKVRASGPLKANKDAGVFTYSDAPAFPAHSYGSSNYWIDVLFVPDAAKPPASGSAAKP